MPEEYLTDIEASTRRLRDRSDSDRGTDPIPTDETVGDPDEGSPEAAGQAGAAAGAIAGTAVAGPIGMAVGAGVGAAAGAATEADGDTAATPDERRKHAQYDDWRQHDDDTED
jgi:hypothetical protein